MTPTPDTPHLWYCSLFLHKHRPNVKCSCPPTILAEAVERERLLALAAKMEPAEGK